MNYLLKSLKILTVMILSLEFCCVVFAQENRFSNVERTLDKMQQLSSESQESIPNPAAGSPSETAVESKSSNAASLEGMNLDVLELKDMEINDVLKLISKKSGINIVAGRDVKGKVTIYLKGVGVREALRIILESNDLAYVEEDTIIKVMTAKDYESTYGRKFGEKTKIKIIPLRNTAAADVAAILNQMKSLNGKVITDDKSNTMVLIETPEKLAAMEALLAEIDVPISTRVFDLSYSKAEDLSKNITEVLTKNAGTLKFDARSNKIVVTDTPRKLDEISRLIKAFDERHKEVLIEAKIVQLALSDAYKMGVDWEVMIRGYQMLDLKSNLNILGAKDITAKRGKLTIGVLSNDDYEVLIDALNTIGTTNILSSPHITAINNQEAKILVGSTQPYATTTTTTPSSGPTTTAESINFIDVGVKLYVTPTIHKDGFITMKIRPEVSSVLSTYTTSTNNQIPIVETSEAETTVMVRDGVTIIIGGLMKDEKKDTVNKIPFLGDVPLLGAAFRNTSKSTAKTELVIFLTPKIISGDVAADTSPETKFGAAVPPRKK